MYDINKDYYKILGVAGDIAQDELRRVFIGLSKQYHPDRYAHNSARQKDAEKIYMDITEAYSILSNPARKKSYDELKDLLKTKAKDEDSVDWAEHYYREGEEALRHKKTDNAIRSLRESVRLKPNTAKYHALLGVAYISKGWQAYAKASFVMAARIEPDNPIAKKHLADMPETPVYRPTQPSSSPFANIYKKK